MLLAIFLVVFAALVYYSLTRINSYWREKGIKYVEGWPFFGNMASYMFKTRSLTEIIDEIYWKYPDERYVGFHIFLEPTLMIRDPDLVKQITVKEFDFFPEHQTFVPEGVDPLWDKNLFAMKGGPRWHDLRSVLSPSFTSSKMKAMFPLMVGCADQFTQHFHKRGGTVTAEMIDTFGRFISDCIATTSFGITCDSLSNKDNQFCYMGQKINDAGGIKRMLTFIHSISPTLMKVLGITMRKKDVNSFFVSVIRDTIKLREEQGITRPDMLYLLLEARKNRAQGKDEEKQGKSEISMDDITAQALDFFAAGVETTSTLLAFTAYELALNPDVQQKLLDEVRATLEADKDGKLTYEGLFGSKYVDMVISESLRKWPPSETTDRRCTKPFTIIPKSDQEKGLTIESNMVCWIPTYCLQRDPKYYPDPEKFDPERFNDENKHKINPFTYLPFGIGPRSCIGMRFAILMAKVAIFETVRNFELVAVKETQIPLVMDKGNFNITTEKGIWVGFKPRTD